jgi:hypothetical protein
VVIAKPCAALLAAVALAAGLVSAAGSHTGTLLTATQVGPLRLGLATPAQVQAFAGKPQHVWRFARNGQIPGNGLFVNRAQAYGYGCTAPVDLHGCRTVYALKSGRLIGFSTRGTGFHTQAGTRVGTSLTQALSREHGQWAGFSVQCPAIVFPASATAEFKANVTRTPPRVADFLISLAAQSFSDGC